MSEKVLSFEEKEARLTEILTKLEANKDLTLQEISALYQEGKTLLEDLNQQLSVLKEQVTHDIVEDK